jgi:FkbM family methyltransferase
METIKPLFNTKELEDLEKRRFFSEKPRWDAERAQGAILFGAGGVGCFFLRFMRTVGAEPAFFIDNNEKLWGTRIEGVEVKSPSALRANPEQTVILCSATYLRQFMEQCREMKAKSIVPYYSFCHAPFPFVSANDVELRQILGGGATREASNIWADEISIEIFKGTLAFLVTHDINDMPRYERGEYFIPTLFNASHYRNFVDGGAFDGDTLQEFLKITDGNFERYDAFEPDPSNYSLLEETVAKLPKEVKEKIKLYRSALGETAGEVFFQNWGNACSAVGSEGTMRVKVEALDDVLKGQNPTYIKLDVEGAEPDALKGMENILRRCRPALAVCVYHTVDHLWNIPLWISGLGLGYRLYLRKHSESYSETVCYAVPE